MEYIRPPFPHFTCLEISSHIYPNPKDFPSGRDIRDTTISVLASLLLHEAKLESVLRGFTSQNFSRIRYN
jgi:hypothetical protein